MKELIFSLANKYHAEFIQIRRQFHRFPELSGKEFKTAEFICEWLEKWKIPFEKEVSKTGVVALIQGKNPQKKTIALRADMDALAINEKTGAAYQSENPGVMHACGHDAHMTILLFAGKIINELRENFEGSVKLIFQPSEEEHGNGAKEMIEAGVLENPKVDEIFGLHVDADLTAGTAGFRKGPMMAASDEIHIQVQGKAGHIAYPDQHVNPVKILNHIYERLENFVILEKPINQKTVLDFGMISVAGKVNVVATEGRMSGAFRSFDEKWRTRGQEKIIEISKNVAEELGGSCEVNIKQGYPVLINDEKLTEQACSWASEILGKENITEASLRMGTEDFAYYAQQCPACFFRLGAALKEPIPLHSDRFDIDETSIQCGASLLSFFALSSLK